MIFFSEKNKRVLAKLKTLKWTFKKGYPRSYAIDGEYNSGVWCVKFSQQHRLPDSFTLYKNGVDLELGRVAKAFCKWKWRTEAVNHKRQVRQELRGI